jgi:hypothetical protein
VLYPGVIKGASERGQKRPPAGPWERATAKGRPGLPGAVGGGRLDQVMTDVLALLAAGFLLG